MSPQAIDFSKYEQGTPSAPPTAIDFSKYEQGAPTLPGFWDTLGREGKSLAGNIAGIPAAVYHAFTDPPTADEKDKFGEDEVAGPKRVGLGIHRLAIAPAETAVDWYSDALRGKIPNAYEQALSVAPEAMGAGGAAVVGPKLASKVPAVLDAASDLATSTVAKAAASAVPDAVAAALKKLPTSLIQRIPYLGNVLTDVYKAGSKAYQEAQKPPVYPGAALPGNPGTFPGAPLPEHPGVFPGAPQPTATPEQLNPALASEARTLPGMHSPEVVKPPAVSTAQPIPARTGLALPGETASVTPSIPAFAAESIPRTLSGESALRQVLDTQPNDTLLKIARSRGVDVSKESLLKPNSAVTNRIINKIVDDFDDDELDNMRSTYLQNQSKHNFGDIGKEANQVLNLQTYFPDLKIPQATLNRVAKAMGTTASAAKVAPEAASQDLSGEWSKNLDYVKKQKQLKELQ